MATTIVGNGGSTNSVSGVIVSSGDTLSANASGVALATTVQNGGFVYVYAGGSTSGTVLNPTNATGSAVETIYAGGTATGTIVNRSAQQVLSGGTAIGTRLAGNAAQLIMYSGAVTSDVFISSGFQTISAGAVSYNTIVSGTGAAVFQRVFGGVASNTVVSAGQQSIDSAGVSYYTSVVGSGRQAVASGVAVSTYLSGVPTTQTIAAGGVASATTLDGGAFQIVLAGGVASSNLLSFGVVRVSAGGQVQGATISSGGITLLASANNTSAYASGLDILKGTLDVYSGALATDVELHSGTITINGGGSVNNATVYAGGTEILIGAANATNTVLSGGRLILTTAIGSSQLPSVTGLVVHSGGSIDLDYLTYAANASATVNVTSAGLLTVSNGGSTVYQLQLSGDYAGDYFHLSADTDGSLILTQDNTPCYCPGTLIATDAGEVLVEDLLIGDRVLNHKGEARAIKWIGHRSFSGRFIAGKREVLPICFKAGSIGENVPRRDLWVSPHHAMYLNGVLIEAKDLVNGVSIYQAASVASVKYFHVELDSHDVIVAEGALAESFVDDNDRGMFHNARDYAALYPEAEAASLPRYYAPRLDAGEEVEAARAALDGRAVSHFGDALKAVA